MPRRAIIPRLCILLALGGCLAGPSVETGLSPGDPCTIVPAPPVPADTIRIALPGPVDPTRAPVARSESERILFGHAYQTLFTLDCRGAAEPRLAVSWRGTDGGRTWLFEIRGDALFHDGSPATASEVVRCWSRSDIGDLVRRAGVDSFSAAGERTFAVHFSRPHEELPAVLSSPPFMIAKRERLRLWPLGTGPYEIEPGPVWAGRPHRGTFTARPVHGARAPVLVFLEPGGRDPRDLLEGGADVMVADDGDVVEYAASRPHLVTAPLPWDRAYVILSTTRVRELRWGRPPAGIPRGLCESLALEAVRGIARGHEGPCWWDSLGGCALLSEGETWRPPLAHSAYSTAGPFRILYPASDPIARDLAERILALAAAGPGPSAQARQLAAAVPDLGERAPLVSVEGVGEQEMDRSLREGSDFAYVIALPLLPADPCAAAAGLIARARWLSGLGGRFAGAILPLVDARSHVIVRRGAAGVSVDLFGTVRVAGAASSGADAPGEP